jgi:hypothetical protein
MLNSEAYRKHLKGEDAFITMRDLKEFFRIDDYLSHDRRDQKIEDAVNTYRKDRKLGDAVAAIAVLLRKELGRSG